MEPLLPILFSFLLFMFMFLKLKTNNSASNLPPGPWKLPLIGNIHQLVGSLPHRRLRDLAVKYGPIMHLQLGEVSNVIFSSAETAKEVLKTHDAIFAQRPSILAAEIITYNCTDIAFAPYGDYWRQLRKICVMELLTMKRVQSLRSIREEEVRNLVKNISSDVGSLTNLSKNLHAFTYSITSRAAFGKVWKGKDVFLPTVKEIIETTGGFSIADLYPSIKFLHRISGTQSKLEKLHRKADEIFENIINEHRVHRKGERKCMEGEADDLVDVLLNLQDRGNLEFPLTIDNIKAIILDMFIAGSDTSSTTVQWTMSELIRNPQVLDKVQAEVRNCFGSIGSINEESIQNLNYLKMVIKETFRLHPPVALLLPRECRETCKIHGYDIPVKTKIIVNAWAIGRDPKYWIEPETFYPERFLNSAIDFKGKDFELIPFGAGRRMCPGVYFGMANVEIALAHLLYHFNWTPPAGMKPEDVDIAEEFGSTVKRKHDLCLIPISYLPPLN